MPHSNHIQYEPGDWILIRRTSPTGRDPQVFRAYQMSGGKPLGFSASTTGNPENAIKKCAAKAFGLTVVISYGGVSPATAERIQIQAIGNNEYKVTLLS